jgi:hypothetical protein
MPRRSTTSTPCSRSSAANRPHGAEDEVHPLAVGAHALQRADRLDEEHARGAVERRVVAHELVAEDERGVAAHADDTAR